MIKWEQGNDTYNDYNKTLPRVVFKSNKLLDHGNYQSKSATISKSATMGSSEEAKKWITNYNKKIPKNLHSCSRIFLCTLK